MRQPKSVYNARYRAKPEGKAAQRKARAMWKKTDHARGIRSDYRITTQERVEMYSRQNGLCGLCSKPMTYRESHCDHIHETGKRRSLVHPTCNMLIGWIERFAGLVPLVKPYIERYEGN